MYLYDEPSGMNETGYFDICPALLDHLNGKTRTKSNQYIKKHLGLGKKSRRDEDVEDAELVVRDILRRVGGELRTEMWDEHPGTNKRVLTKILTPYGAWENDIKNLIAKGATKAGRYEIKVDITLFLCYELALDYPEIAIGIFKSFNQGELEQIRRGLTYLAKKYNIKIKDHPHPLLIDKHFFLFFDSERWKASIRDHPVFPKRCQSKEKIDLKEMTIADLKKRFRETFRFCFETVDAFFDIVDAKHDELFEETKKADQKRDWIFVTSYISAIECAEREMKMKMLKNKGDLCDIFGMSKRDFYRKLQFFAH